MTPAQGLAFVEQHGIVLEAARHPRIPSLAQAIAGRPVHGNWWSHPQGRAIFAITRAVRESRHVLVCRVVEGKISFVHERLWPPLVRLGHRLPGQHLARLHETHAPSGQHRVEEIAFPDWVPPATAAAAQEMSEAHALAALDTLLPELAAAP